MARRTAALTNGDGEKLGHLRERPGPRKNGQEHKLDKGVRTVKRAMWALVSEGRRHI